jgi:hypothetical protein
VTGPELKQLRKPLGDARGGGLLNQGLPQGLKIKPFFSFD